jgi:hypothetical protein
MLLNPRNRPWRFGLGLTAVAFAPGLTFAFATVFAPNQRQLCIAVAMVALLQFWGMLERSELVAQRRTKMAILLLAIAIAGFAVIALPVLVLHRPEH